MFVYYQSVVWYMCDTELYKGNMQTDTHTETKHMQFVQMHTNFVAQLRI